MSFIRVFLQAFQRRQGARRLVELDGGALIQAYGPRAVARALQYEAEGAVRLIGGRRRGHWGRVARCIARRPSAIRTAFV